MPEKTHYLGGIRYFSQKDKKMNSMKGICTSTLGIKGLINFLWFDAILKIRKNSKIQKTSRNVSLR